MLARIKFPFEMTFLDYPDQYDWAILIYVIGCDNSCKKCHNIKFKNFSYNDSIIDADPQQTKKIIEESSLKYMTYKVVLSGGDPLAFFNAEWTRELINLFINTPYRFCIYTGHDIDTVKKYNISGFEFIKTGVYDENFGQDQVKNDSYMTFASTNQKLYNGKLELLSHNGRYNFI